MNKCLIVLFCLLFLSAPHVMAVPVQFSASGFNPTAGTYRPSPIETIYGFFEYDLDSSNFLSINEFDMTIKNKIYSLTDIIIRQPWGPTSVMIGAEGNATSITPRETDDFWFMFNYLTGNVSSFAYTTVENSGLWSASTYETEVGAPVPEPSTAILLGSGLLGIGWYRRKKART